ncbi:efflux RND transporter periplasmic adaptor subunit [Roseospirillum parvum]|uniref:Membrane fusion protein, multidrug efflux system n=1 Tax=Roseospirillum parvum TaxID=83401 RepID=A0A1G7Z6X5_9PROT|nr:efflux RND transporter periplasmic adaptor subunit [Roseospirillum parvum]SDH04367.1 membrane fusion protein, multidrug efflux system [Roseospirillum parvum]
MRASYLIAGAIALAAAGWIASGVLSGPAEPPPAESAKGPEAAPAADEAAEAPLAVRVATVRAIPHVSTLTVNGRTEAARKVSIRTETSGRVSALGADKGETVAAGQVLVELALDDRAARLDEAKALLEQRRIEVDAARELAASNYTSRTKLAQAEAALAQAQAGLAAIRLDLSRTRIEAPFAGLLNQRPVEQGDWVGVGETVATLLELDPLKVLAEVPEMHVAALRPDPGGAADPTTPRVDIRLIDGRRLEGRITFVSAEADPQTRTFAVEITVRNPDHDIPEGMTAEVRLPLRQVMAHRVSPALLTLNDAGEVGVKLVDDDNTVRFLKARIVDDSPDGIWLAGLPDPARVISVGQEFVLEGQTVRPVPVSASSPTETPADAAPKAGNGLETPPPATAGPAPMIGARAAGDPA